MVGNERSASAGGAATTQGTTFQENVACYFSVLILAESEAHLPLSLSDGVRLSGIILESTEPVDDIAVETSGGGIIYIQVKTSVDLSSVEQSAFASALDQFVRQFIAGASPLGASKRPLDRNLDRLVLAVGPTCPATITNHLQSVLSKVRNCGSPDALERLLTTLNTDERRSLQTARDHIDRVWRRERGAPPSSIAELALLHLIHVMQLDLRPDGNSTNLAMDRLRTSIVSDPNRATDAWRALIEICRAFGPKRTGGNLLDLRAALTSRGLPLASTPSYRADIEAVKKYSHDRLYDLARLSQIDFDGRPIKIERPVVAALRAFVAEDHTVIVGEPGAGKSGCMHDLAARLIAGNHDVMLLAADKARVTTLATLSEDLRISGDRTPVDVLENWTGDGTGYLIVDALDAARGGIDLRTICDMLHDVRERANRWRIVVSIREFDLRTSPAVQRLFAGTPHSEYRDERFAKVRHLRIKRLTSDELNSVTDAHPSIAECLNRADDSLRELVTNPFNLRLLCQLIADNVSQTEINSVRTQIGLLDLYWAHRVEGQDSNDPQNDPAAQEYVLKSAVDLMVEKRELHIRRLTLAQAVGPHTTSINFLLRHGVLVSSSPQVGTDSALSFAHNILFDYAVNRLWVDEISDDTIQKLSRVENSDLLLAIRASICMAFEHKWYEDPSRSTFWQTARKFVATPDMRLIGKIIAGGVAADQYRQPEECREILNALGVDRVSEQLLVYMVQAGVTRHESDPVRFPMFGETNRNWLGLAVSMCEHLDTTAWEVRRLLVELNRTSHQLTEQQRSDANFAARKLLTYGLANPPSRDVVRPAIETATKTFAADPAATAGALRPLLGEKAIEMGGHKWLHPLARAIETIAAHAPDFALDLVDVAFSVTGDRDEAVPMGGRILAINFNKADMFRMGRHDISGVFPRLMERHPVVATRIFLGVMHQTVEGRHGEAVKQSSNHPFTFREMQAHIRDDGSYIWMQGAGGGYDDWWKIYHGFISGLQNLAESADNATVAEVLRIIGEETEYAVIWNALLLAAKSAPSTLGPQIADLLASPHVLGEIDTRKAAGDFLAVGFQYLSPQQRRAIEAAILSLREHTPPDLQSFADERRDRLLGCIPRKLLESQALVDRLGELDAKGGAPPNEAGFSIHVSSGPPEEHWYLRRRGIKPESSENAPLIAASKELKRIPELRASESLETARVIEFHAILEHADSAITEGYKSNADTRMIEELEAELTAACTKIARPNGLERSAPLYDFIRRVLLRSSQSPRPEFQEGDEKQWEEGHPFWGSPSTRIDSAAGLMLLAARTNTVDRDILNAVERLAEDQVPAVRFQVLTSLSWLHETAPDLMWKLIKRCCLEERLGEILSFFCANIALNAPPSNFARLEPLVRRLYERCRRKIQHKNVLRTCATFYLRAAIWRNDQRGAKYLDVYARSPTAFPEEVGQIITHCRELIRFEDPNLTPEKNHGVRVWAFNFLTNTVHSLQSLASDLRSKHPDTPLLDWPEDHRNELRQAYVLIDHVATELYFGSGAFNEKKEGDDAYVAPSIAEKLRILNEGNLLFDALCSSAFVEAAYRVLETLEFLVESDHSSVILRIATLVKSAAEDGIQYEGMAADLIVRIVERYLSEYGNTLRERAEVRSAILDVLDAFVAAGWPQATRLTYRLSEVFR